MPLLIPLPAGPTSCLTILARILARSAGIAIALAGVTGCTPGFPDHARHLQPQSTAARQQSSRCFATSDEGQVLAAGSAALQAVGFTIDQTVPPLGLLVASKREEAQDGLQQAQSVVLGLTLGVYLPTDDYRRLRISLTTQPVNNHQINLRLTGQRLLYDSQGQISRADVLTDPTLRQQIFDQLAEKLALTAAPADHCTAAALTGDTL